MKNNMELSIVMPCLNEERTLGRCIEKARQYIANSRIKGEIIVADNGSTDKSCSIASKLADKLVLVEKKGYGSALRAGIKEADGQFVIMGDADDSYDFLALDVFIHALRNGHDLVMGNRFKGGIRPNAMPWLHRYIGNPVLSCIGRILFWNNIGDFHCGLRGFTKKAYDRIAPQTDGMEFASELVVKAVQAGMKITEVPTILYPDGRNRPPHLQTWRDGYGHLKLMLSLFCTHIFNKKM